ncbi:methyl-accepting chemotaxis protein [Fundidesulfovibrio butyratiphilus]
MNAFLGNLSVRMKIFCIIALLIGAMLALGTYAWLSVSAIVVNGQVYEQVVSDKDLVADILPPPMFLVETYVWVHRLGDLRDPAEIGRVVAKLKELNADFEERKTYWMGSTLPENIKRMVGGRVYATGRAFYDTLFNQVVPAMTSGDSVRAGEIISTTLRDQYDAHRKAVDELVTVVNARVKDTEAQADRDIRRIVLHVGLAGLATVLCMLGLGLAITLRITRPLGKVMQYANDLSEGRLDSELHVTQRDEIGLLADHLRLMVRTLKLQMEKAREQSDLACQEAEKAKQAACEADEAKLVVVSKQDQIVQLAREITDVAKVVEHSSDKLADQVRDSSEGASRQAERVSETAAAMSEMTQSVFEVAKNASQAADAAGQAKQMAQEGAQVVDKVVAGIGLAERQALGLKEEMSTLGQQAEGIGRVMDVISDIADQTNLLALNAAIEAARAGEAGRGFAVVADEVRKLAEKTMHATKEVGQAIAAIQSGTRSNVEHMQQAVVTIQQATGLATTSGEALAEIVRLVDSATDQVRSIAAASQQQSAASEQINRSIEEVNRISAQTSKAMRHSADAVTGLNDQALALRNLLSAMDNGA